MCRLRWGPFLAAMLLPAGAWAQGTALEVKATGTKTFYANSRAGNNQVTFMSESTLEDFTGVCNRVGGDCQLDPKDLSSFKGRFFVRVEDMRTGIALRDKELRAPDWLDAAKHPLIVMEFTSVEDVKKVGPDAAEMTLVGTCSLHGKTRDVRIPATLRYLDESPKTMRRVKGDLIRLRAKFVVKLADYAISGPKASDVLGLKVSNDIEVRVTVFGSTERPPDPLKGDTAEADAKRQAPRRPPPRREGGG